MLACLVFITSNVKQTQGRAFADPRYHHSNIVNSRFPLIKSHFNFATLIFFIQVIKYFNTGSHSTLLLHLSGNCGSGVRREIAILMCSLLTEDTLTPTPVLYRIHKTFHILYPFYCVFYLTKN